jgi:hypothetical protein
MALVSSRQPGRVRLRSMGYTSGCGASPTPAPSTSPTPAARPAAIRITQVHASRSTRQISTALISPRRPTSRRSAPTRMASMPTTMATAATTGTRGRHRQCLRQPPHPRAATPTTPAPAFWCTRQMSTAPPSSRPLISARLGRTLTVWTETTMGSHAKLTRARRLSQVPQSLLQPRLQRRPRPLQPHPPRRRFRLRSQRASRGRRASVW